MGDKAYTSYWFEDELFTFEKIKLLVKRQIRLGHNQGFKFMTTINPLSRVGCNHEV